MAHRACDWSGIDRLEGGRMCDTDYELLCAQLRELSEAEPHWLPVLANASALIMEALPNLNWAGFYLTDVGAEAPSLVLGPFQGKVACVRIPYGRGVCGTAAAQNKPQLVPNVHEFPGHIACDSASNSEVVIPLHASGSVIGVLDLDSPLLSRFSDKDFAGLQAVVSTVETCASFVGLPFGR